VSSPTFNRALLLYEQSRYDLAVPEFRQVLAQDPDHAMAHAFLSLCFAQTEQFKDATEEAQAAVRLAPDMGLGYCALAQAWFHRNYLREAEDAIHEAIRLEPDDPNYYSVLASIHLHNSKWQEALNAAEQGLQCDAEHVNCTNLRAVAMVKLGRKKEAGLTIGSALAKNPEDSFTHANQGWTYLERADYAKALEHFRESLRLDPTNEWARQGIVEALKAKNPVYGLMLRYFLWMAKLPPKTQWMFILGFYFGRKVLGAISEQNPSLRPIILPILILSGAFVIMTWIADPLFNTFLRFNRFGRLALSREQTVASNLIGGAVVLSLLCFAGIFIFRDGRFVLAGILTGLMVLPFCGIFKCHIGWPRFTMMAVSGLLALVAAAALYLTFTEPKMSENPASAGLIGFFLMGIFFSTIGINFLVRARPRL
jgi:tetratricopeptide (TPR) repeat protein